MSPARPPAVAVRAVTRKYDGVTAVREIDFTVPPGTTTALVGPPGAGKSTLLRLLLGLLAPSSGTVSVDESAAGWTGYRPIGAVLQPRGLHPARTPRGQLRLGAAAAGVPDEQISALLALTRLDEVAQTRIRELSDGQRTRLALAVALLGDPPLLMLDDPLAGLETAERSWLLDYLRRHAQRGGTTVLTTQSLAAVLPIADDLLVLSSGSVVYHGSPRRLRRSHPDRLVVAVSSPIALATALAANGFTDTVMRGDGRLAVAEATRAQIQAAAGAARVQLREVIPEPVHPDRVLAALTKGPVVTPPPISYGMSR